MRYASPRKRASVFALAGDSTITNGFACLPGTYFSATLAVRPAFTNSSALEAQHPAALPAGQRASAPREPAGFGRKISDDRFPRLHDPQDRVPLAAAAAGQTPAVMPLESDRVAGGNSWRQSAWSSSITSRASSTTPAPSGSGRARPGSFAQPARARHHRPPLLQGASRVMSDPLALGGLDDDDAE